MTVSPMARREREVLAEGELISDKLTNSELGFSWKFKSKEQRRRCPTESEVRKAGERYLAEHAKEQWNGQSSGEKVGQMERSTEHRQAHWLADGYASSVLHRAAESHREWKGPMAFTPTLVRDMLPKPGEQVRMGRPSMTDRQFKFLAAK